MKKNKLKTRQLSARLLYGMVGVALLLFALFYLVGYDMPYVFDPQYNSPLFTDGVLVFIYLMLAAAVAAAVCSVARESRLRSRSRVVNRIPVRKISLSVGGGLLAVMAAACALGSGQPLAVNGRMFDDALWLRLSDMFIATVGVMLLAAAAAVALSVLNAGSRRGRTTGRGKKLKTGKQTQRQ